MIVSLQKRYSYFKLIEMILKIITSNLQMVVVQNTRATKLIQYRSKAHRFFLFHYLQLSLEVT